MQKNNPGLDLTFEQHLCALANSGKTAISRKSFSAPYKKLISLNIFEELKPGTKVLDYGCGKGTDIKLLKEKYPHLIIDGYDPHHKELNINSPYGIITCNYVLNVISAGKIRESILTDIREYLSENGKAYIAVRNDLTNLKGLTSIGTWQGYVELDLDVLATNKNFKMYRMVK